jgi:plastocyanin
MVAAGAVLATGCGGDGGDEGAAADRPAASATLAAPASSTGGGTDDVRIASFAFAPATVRAKVGQRVTWEHRDAGVTHTVTAVEFRSGELEEGDEFSHLFRTAGTFAYRCAIHPDMRGTVRVGG